MDLNKLLKILILIVLFMASNGRAAVKPFDQAKKAQYIINLTKFIRWPGDNQNHFNICVAADDSLVQEL